MSSRTVPVSQARLSRTISSGPPVNIATLGPPIALGITVPQQPASPQHQLVPTTPSHKDTSTLIASIMQCTDVAPMYTGAVAGLNEASRREITILGTGLVIGCILDFKLLVLVVVMIALVVDPVLPRIGPLRAWLQSVAISALAKITAMSDRSATIEDDSSNE